METASSVCQACDTPVPQDVQLCELANPAKWDNDEWMTLLRSLQVLPQDKLSMHRKAYEYTQTVFGLTRLQRLRPPALQTHGNNRGRQGQLVETDLE